MVNNENQIYPRRNFGQLQTFAALTFIFCIFLLMAYSLSFLLTSPKNESKHQTDQELITHFHKNKAKFNQLIQMAEQEEKLLPSIYLDVAYYDSGNIPASEKISGQRLREYRELLWELGLKSLHVSRNSKTNKITSISFGASSDSSSPQGIFQTNYTVSWKGYIFFRNGAEHTYIQAEAKYPFRANLAKSLDGYHNYNEALHFYRQVEDNLYLEFRMDASSIPFTD